MRRALIAIAALLAAGPTAAQAPAPTPPAPAVIVPAGTYPIRVPSQATIITGRSWMLISWVDGVDPAPDPPIPVPPGPEPPPPNPNPGPTPPPPPPPPPTPTPEWLTLIVEMDDMTPALAQLRASKLVRETLAKAGIVYLEVDKDQTIPGKDPSKPKERQSYLEHRKLDGLVRDKGTPLVVLTDGKGTLVGPPFRPEPDPAAFLRQLGPYLK